METVTKMGSATNISVSAEDYAILSCIASDFDKSIDEIAHEVIMQGVRFSGYRLYEKRAVMLAQQKATE